MDDIEFRAHVLEKLRAIDNRIALLEDEVTDAVEAYSKARHWVRRIPFRPPLWKLEQYSPRPISIPAVEKNAQPPQSELRIAIVTPSYNSGQFLRATIESVLNQGYNKLVYVVQDGASKDGTVSLLKEYGDRIVWHSNPDNGQTSAINLGFEGVDCDIMGYLNADDVLLPGALTYVSEYFRTHPDIDVVYGHRIFIDADGLEIGRALLPKHDERALVWADYVPQETMFWRRRVWDAIGPFDEQFHYALDWDFILRAQAAGFKFVRLARFLACFRVHDGQKTARLYEFGRREMQKLRKRHLGYIPGSVAILFHMVPYLTRQLLYHWLYKLRLLKI